MLGLGTRLIMHQFRWAYITMHEFRWATRSTPVMPPHSILRLFGARASNSSANTNLSLFTMGCNWNNITFCTLRWISWNVLLIQHHHELSICTAAAAAAFFFFFCLWYEEWGKNTPDPHKCLNLNDHSAQVSSMHTKWSITVLWSLYQSTTCTG